MFTRSVLAIALAVATQSALALSTAEKSLTLVHYGFWGQEKEYRLAYGDTSQQDAIANSPTRSAFGPFAMNAAFYFHNPDGTWNLFNFRLPSESMTDPAAIEERARYREYLSRPDVRALMQSPYEKENFGKPEDYIYKRMGLKTEELPEPFNKYPEAALEKIDSIFQYNADSTAKIYFRKPHDLEGKAQLVLEEIQVGMGLLH